MKFSSLLLFSIFLNIIHFAQNPEWINYTYNEEIQSIVGRDNILWLATSGGLVKFNVTSEEKEYFNVSNSGLVSNKISSLALDSLGNVWMWKHYERALCFHDQSTDYLIRFDGNEWTYFSPNLDICENWGTNPNNIEIDNNNEVWIGTNSDGLYNFNGISWNYFDTTNSYIPTNRIDDIAIDSNNKIWMISRECRGVMMFNGNTWVVFDSSNSNCPNDIFNNLEIDNRGKIWVSTLNKVITYDGNTWEDFDGEIPNDSRIWYRALKIDNNNEPWFLEDHLHHYSESAWKTHQIEPFLQYYNPSAFFIDKFNNKWLNSNRYSLYGYEDYNKGGLTKFDSSGWSIYNLTESKLRENRVGSIFRDSKDNIWLGSDIITEINYNTWSYHSPKFDNAPIGSSTSINEDSNGNMWFGTQYDGLVKYDGIKWEVFNTKNSAIPSNTIYDFDIDKEGNIWLTTHAEIGLVKYDGTNFTVYDSADFKLPENYIHQVECDSKGNVWFGVDGVGLVKYDHNTWTVYDEQIKWNEISGLYIDQEDCIWIGGCELTSFKDGVWNFYEHDDSVGYYLNYITEISKDSQDNIWVIARYGVYKFDGGNWQKFDHTNSGLPDNFLFDIEIDQYDNLWIGSRSGVFLYKEGGVVTKIDKDQLSTILNSFQLFQNYPNPFNPSTIIKYSIPHSAIANGVKQSQEITPSQSPRNANFDVTLKIYDILGSEVDMLVNAKQTPGNYEVSWNASEFSTGVYFYRLLAGDYVESKKMILLR